MGCEYYETCGLINNPSIFEKNKYIPTPGNALTEHIVNYCQSDELKINCEHKKVLDINKALEKQLESIRRFHLEI